MTAIPAANRQVSFDALRALRRQESVLAALEVFHAHLGDVFQIPLPGFNPIMLVGAEANQFVLVKERTDLRWRAEQDPITRLLRHGVLVEDGEFHDSLRRQMNPALHRRMLAGYADVMWRGTDRVIDNWSPSEPALDMLIETRKIALLILTETLFGVDFQPQLNALWGAILRTLRYISPGPWLIWRDVPRFGYRRAQRQLDTYLYQIITQRRDHPTTHNDLLGTLIATGMPDALIRDQLLTMIIAGHDTCTALLSWALYLLSSHSEIRANTQAEIDRVLGTNPPDFARIGELHYLEQVVNETLRLYPPVHLGSRVANHELEFQGYSIPAGRRVVYSIYLTHRDLRYWENPAAFMPERFSHEQAQARPPYAFLPYGGGPRNCIGMAFAQIQTKVVLARILQRFDIAFCGDKVHPHMAATLEPRPGVKVKVQRRSTPPNGA